MNIDLNKINVSLRQAVALHESGKIQEALEIYEKFNREFPNQVDVLSLLGTAQSQLGDYKQGMQTLHAALKINPFNPNVYNNLGNALRELNLFEDALQCYEIAISQKADYAHAHNNRGLTLKDLGKFDEALKSYSKAIQLDKDYAEPHNNIGNIYADQKRVDLALEQYNKAIEINPKYANAYWNKSLLLLMMGKYQEGWKLYEWRWEAQGTKYKRNLSGRLWLGDENIARKMIFIYAEQGLGDTIQFVRYIKLLKDLGAHITLEVQPQLVSTLKNYEGVNVIGIGDPIPKYDYYCPLLSLPFALKTSFDGIPNDIPYVQADQGKIKNWQVKLGSRTKKRIGLVWSGGFRPDQPEVWAINKRRNISLAYFEPLRDIDADFFSLQKGKEAQEELIRLTSDGWIGPKIIDYTNDLHDFSDTAAFIENLDLIISVDTSTAHMAGALGKEVWILSRYDNCWRWLIDRKDSPWYPTATIFRQSEPGEWEVVIQELKSNLKNVEIGKTSHK
jgi:tetratricopeptide (TPR) repeat protein